MALAKPSFSMLLPEPVVPCSSKDRFVGRISYRVVMDVEILDLLASMERKFVDYIVTLDGIRVIRRTG